MNDGEGISLSELLDAAQHLRGQIDDNVPRSDRDPLPVRYFCDLMLSGLRHDDQRRRSTHVNLQVDDEEDVLAQHLKVFRDVDSALVVSNTFPWEDAYDVNSILPKINRLKNFHARVRFSHGEGDPIERDPGQDFALWWGQCGEAGRHSLYMVFPEYENSQAEESAVHAAVYAAAYDTVLRYHPDMLPSWLPTYIDEWRRAKSFKSKQPSKSRKAIDRDRGVDFGEDVMALIRQQPFGQHAYWVLQVRNAKDLTRHRLERNHENQQTNLQSAADELLTHVRTDTAVVLIDVGLELHAPATHGIAAYREDLQALARQVLGITDEEYSRGNARIDPWAGLGDLAGLRLSLAKHPAGPARATYLQVYTSDKAALYNASAADRIPRLPAMSIVRCTKEDDHIQLTTQMLNNLISNNDENHPIVLRVEARIKLRNLDLLPAIQIAQLRPLVCVMPASDMWFWRIQRCQAVWYMIQEATAPNRAARGQREALTLVAALAYLWNMTHISPPCDQWDRELCRVVFDCETLANGPNIVGRWGFWSPLFPNGDVPIMYNGAAWLPVIRWPDDTTSNVLRFQDIRWHLEEEEIAKIFATPFADIQALFSPGHLKPQAVRLYKRNVKPSRPVAPRAIQHPDSFPIPAPQTAFDYGADLDPAAQYGTMPDDPDTPDNAGQMCLSILSEVLQRIGLDRGAKKKYCALTPEQRQAVSFETFKDPDIAKYFNNGFYWARCSEDWLRTRNLLFPIRGSNVDYSATQGWKSLPTFQKYLHLFGDPIFPELSKFCHTSFDDLLWFPMVFRDKCINTAPHGNGIWRAVEVRKGARAVHIIMNPSKRPREPTVGRGPRRAILDAQAVAQHEARGREEDGSDSEELEGLEHAGSSRHPLTEIEPPRRLPAELAAEEKKTLRVYKGRAYLRPHAWQPGPDDEFGMSDIED